MFRFFFSSLVKNNWSLHLGGRSSTNSNCKDQRINGWRKTPSVFYQSALTEMGLLAVSVKLHLLRERNRSWTISLSQVSLTHKSKSCLHRNYNIGLSVRIFMELAEQLNWVKFKLRGEKKQVWLYAVIKVMIKTRHIVLVCTAILLCFEIKLIVPSYPCYVIAW